MWSPPPTSNQFISVHYYRKLVKVNANLSQQSTVLLYRGSYQTLPQMPLFHQKLAHMKAILTYFILHVSKINPFYMFKKV